MPRKRPKYALFGDQGEGLKCLGGPAPKHEATWDIVTIVGASWGGFVGAKYGRPATGAFLGAAVPILLHWILPSGED